MAKSGDDTFMAGQGEPTPRLAELPQKALLPLVGVAAGLGLAWPGVGRALVGEHGIDLALIVLIGASALSVPNGWAGRLRPLGPRLGLVLVATTTVLPVIAFALSELVAPGALRRGVLAVGVAPVEVASLAVTGIAGGDTAVAACLLVVSTFVTVVAGVPILVVLAGGGLPPFGVLAKLVAVIGFPLAAGLAGRRAVEVTARAEQSLEAVSVMAVVVLVWLVTSEVHLSPAYFPVTAVLVAFVLACTGVGLLLGRLMPPSAAPGVVLTVAMRDFAVAAGVATAAFGASAAGPMGIYGVLVMAWGAMLSRPACRRLLGGQPTS